MHELVGSKGKYTITEHYTNEAALCSLSGILSSEVKGEPDQRDWRQFVGSRDMDQNYAKVSIAESRKRCLQMGVDPALRKCKAFRDEKSGDAEYRFLCDVVKNSATDLTKFLKEKNLLFTISDRHGYLAGAVGSYKTLLKADSLYFGPGANWSEQSVGTNAIGTSLVTGLPQRVIGTEHYCESHQSWVCSAAPIFDINGEIYGCVDISGPMSSDHSRNLALAVYYAKTIEALLFQKQCMGMVGQFFNKTIAGLLTLDRRGRVFYANNIAVELFDCSEQGCTGRDASSWFDLSPFFDTYSGGLSLGSDAIIELRCLHNPTWNVFAAPLANSSRLPYGLVLCVYPQPPALLQRPVDIPADLDDSSGIIGRSTSIHQVLKQARRVASTHTTVLITGASGTGKEVLARTLHLWSPRAKKTFVAVNCGAIAPDLIQSELFGYAEGAFTGARRNGQTGKFEQASGGTLFLDEIGEMPLSIQVNLLRVLDEKQVVRVGGKRTIDLDVRVIAATNKDMEKMVEDGRFRQDLYYRLHVVELALPPLAERENDVQLLADHFIREFAQKFGQQIKSVTPQFRQALAAYLWPGNVRELRHVIESAVVLLEGDILGIESLPKKIREVFQHVPGELIPTALPKSQCGDCTSAATNPADGFLKKETSPPFATLNFDEIQKRVLQQAMEQYGGNVSKVAKAVGIARNTTYAKLKKYQLL